MKLFDSRSTFRSTEMSYSSAYETIVNYFFFSVYHVDSHSGSCAAIAGHFWTVFGEEGVTFDQNTDEPITGVVQTYYEHGQLATIENYKDGRRDGISEIFHYENGNWKRRENYKEGMRDGLQEKFYENGQLQIKENFIDGQKDGLREEFHSNGQLRSRESYKDGERTGFLEKYNGLGQLLSKQCFQKGRKAESSLCTP